MADGMRRALQSIARDNNSRRLVFEGNLLRDIASRPRLERVVSSTISVRHHIPCTPESVARRGSANNTRVHASLFGHVGEGAARLVSTVAVRHAVAVCPVSLKYPTYTASEGSDNVISLAPLPPRQTKPPWCLASLSLPPFFFFFFFLPCSHSWHCRNPDWVSWDPGTGPLDESSLSPPPDISFASRVFETSVRWSPGTFLRCQSAPAIRAREGPVPFRPCGQCATQKPSDLDPALVAGFFSLFLFCFPPVTGGKTAWLRAAAKAVKHPPVH